MRLGEVHTPLFSPEFKWQIVQGSKEQTLSVSELACKYDVNTNRCPCGYPCTCPTSTPHTVSFRSSHQTGAYYTMPLSINRIDELLPWNIDLSTQLGDAI